MSFICTQNRIFADEEVLFLAYLIIDVLQIKKVKEGVRSVDSSSVLVMVRFPLDWIEFDFIFEILS